jgi:hypothetical protein
LSLPMCAALGLILRWHGTAQGRKAKENLRKDRKMSQMHLNGGRPRASQEF